MSEGKFAKNEICYTVGLQGIIQRVRINGWDFTIGQVYEVVTDDGGVFMTSERALYRDENECFDNAVKVLRGKIDTIKRGMWETHNLSK